VGCVGPTLSTLNINSWRETTAESLENIASARELRILDVGWNRALDDFVIKAIMEGCPKLEEIKCFGCNRVTAKCPRKVCLPFFVGLQIRRADWSLGHQMNVNLTGVESFLGTRQLSAV
jgi:DNA repair protein RAD7